METPWGRSDSTKKLAEGIVSVSTPSHGGIHLDEKRNALIPEYMRSRDGWYEEDCEWAIPAVVIPGILDEHKEAAKQSLKHWNPDAYERYYNVVLARGESRTKDERFFMLENANKYIGMAAFGDWHAKVPKGMVGVFAGRGGRLENGRYPKDQAWFLVPKFEYEPGRYGFIVDESKHVRIEALQ